MSSIRAHVLVDAIVAGLELRHPDLQSEAARGYLGGARVRRTTRARVLRAFDESLVDNLKALGLITARQRDWTTDHGSVIAGILGAWDENVERDGLDVAILDLALRLYGAALLCLGTARALLAALDVVAAQSPLV